MDLIKFNLIDIDFLTSYIFHENIIITLIKRLVEG